MLTYQAISAMPQYRGTSFEEIRVQDYAQNRKAPTAAAPGTTGFGSSAFGAAAQPAGGVFGAAAQPQQPPAFGATNTGTSAFGSTNAGSAFGGGAFGGAQNNQPSTTAFGGFGQTQPQPQQQQSTGFGAFGQTQPQQQQPSTGGGLFGGGSAFGAAANNQPKSGTGSAFGGGTSAFGQSQPAAGGGLFGAAANNNAQQPSTGLFGANQNQNKSLFGGTTTGTGFGATGGGLFGATQQQQNPQQNTGGGLFGAGNTGGGLFGANNNQQQPQQPATGGGLFGATNNQPNTGGGLFSGGGGLFGSTNSQQNQNNQQQSTGFGGGLFGAKPAQSNPPAGGGLFGGGGNTGGGLFGSTNNNNQQQSNTGGGLFGNLGQSTNNQQQNQGSSLFGAKPTQPMGQSTSTGGGLFGGGGGGLFGNSTNSLMQSQAPPQQTLTASINEPIGANLPIFSMLPPGPRAVDIEPPKKKPSFFVDVPTRTPVPRLQLSYQPAQSKLRGFSSVNGSSQLTMSLANGKPGALSLSQSQSKSAGPDMFLNGASPQFGSGSRRSVKKLVLDKKIEPQELFTRTNSPSPSPKPMITFDPALSRAAREREYAEQVAGRPAELPTPVKQRTAPRFTAVAAEDGVGDGEYWTKPDLAVLKHKGHAELSEFPSLIVGRAGYGEILFLEPVDLTGLGRLKDLYGDVVRFDDKECSVYPDVDDNDKPPPGHGLNVRARISLQRCWPLDKATREPIKDSKHPVAVKQLKKLKGMKDTHFEAFDYAEGKWTFTVDHF
ncbi:nucleoporin autopeptidase-domain-containing protein [Schizophyllum amplum]|uniref:Nucleoporin autopeptidase-domain-containing protein n=1 Tax=Schizophyllum amplum TaxID=97359 RepID=A0A550CSV6_9AGAR|nr:nucleoporin autopeptidase-domain-containing protein [Auriculariopsis ampla]